MLYLPHEVLQHISVRRQLYAFMQTHGTALAVALAPELMHFSQQPEKVRRPALDRSALSIREALSVHLASGVEVYYSEDDRDILTAIGLRPDRASRTDNQAKYLPEQSQIFMRRLAMQNHPKSV